MASRAIILLKADHGGTFEIRLKAQNIAHLGPTPSVDGLVIIPHHAKIGMPLCQKTQPQILGHIGVLVFIDQNKGELALILLQNIFMRLKDGYHMQQQIAKITGIQRGKALLIKRI